VNPAEHAAGFPSTHWSVVLAAGRSTSPESRRALESLCAAYWPPVYAHLRRAGRNGDDASDLTQEFFARLLAGDTLNHADAARGRFRSYLLGALKHFLADQHDRTSAQKRGGGRGIFSLDAIAGEDSYTWEPMNGRTPDQLYERRWALALMARVLKRLEEECSLAGKAVLFTRLKGFLTDGTTAATYPEVAAALDMTEANVRMTVTRLRRRYGELVRAEVARTVGSPEEVEDEMRHLLQVLRFQS
jgi:RNA polymerase sigma-70 factor (ECF subfamily)